MRFIQSLVQIANDIVDILQTHRHADIAFRYPLELFRLSNIHERKEFTQRHPRFAQFEGVAEH